ncbi:sugar phosphorylase [Dongshaea marina]|uniref:sugar phosphorylase n=1 Tax=Dongshaea marina TaxID=2047966 RepID=UPI000D3E1019|nr:sugar phosphorylase [Dongshaea marina]
MNKQQADLFKDKLEQRIARIYPDQDLSSISQKIMDLIARWQGTSNKAQWIDETTCYLICYGDSIACQDQPTLRGLKIFADRYLKGKISDIHILPMFPYTSDDGFSVLDYRKVDPILGDWPDLNDLAEHFDLMYDCVINHISKSSDWFRGYLAGEEKYRNFFIQGDLSQDYSSVTRPRTHPLFTPFTKEDGEQVHLWTTFSEDQVDLNFSEPGVLLESIDILLQYVANGGRSIRLDAIGFIWKQLGTRCIHLPQAHEIIKLWRQIVDLVAPGTRLITETNVPHQENISYFGAGDEAHMVYQFPLPPLTLHALLREDSSILSQWARELSAEAMENLSLGRKTSYFNFLASHDGIGMRPTEGILSDSERQFICHEAERKGGRVTYKSNGDGSQSPYELNINYLSALCEPTDSNQLKARKFLAAQSILLSLIGVPAIYYHSLLGSSNDRQGMLESGINRRINREKLKLEPLEQELDSSGSLRQLVFSQFATLLELRKGQAAFSPMAAQQVLELGDKLFALRRGNGADTITYILNISSDKQPVALAKPGFDLVSQSRFTQDFELEPYQFVWLKEV